MVLLGPRHSGKSALAWRTARGQAPGGVGYLPQAGGDSLLPWLGLQDNVAWGLRVAGHPDADTAERCASLAGSLGLRLPKPDVLPFRATRRDRQAAALLRTLLAAGRCLVLDEPLEPLDPAEARSVALPLASWIRTRGVPCLWITARPEEALRVGDALLLQGLERPWRPWPLPPPGVDPEFALQALLSELG